MITLFSKAIFESVKHSIYNQYNLFLESSGVTPIEAQHQGPRPVSSTQCEPEKSKDISANTGMSTKDSRDMFNVSFSQLYVNQYLKSNKFTHFSYQQVR